MKDTGQSYVAKVLIHLFSWLIQGCNPFIHSFHSVYSELLQNS
jgi:hypothetical protein